MNKEHIQKQLSKIIESKTFSRSDANQRLLNYLTEATLKQQNPKEYTIGVDVFNKTDADSNSSNIRVYIHKLRKKLEKYYSEEGQEDDIIFSIPSGNYTIKFDIRKHRSKQKSPLRYWIMALALCNVLLLAFLLKGEKQDTNISNYKFWTDLLKNKKPTVLVTGNYFFFSKRIEGHKNLNIRDTKINNESQLNEYIRRNELNFDDYDARQNAAYMPRDALFSMPELIPVLHDNKVNYSMLISSDFNWEIFKEHNIVYVGSMKNLHKLDLIFDKLGVHFDKTTDQLIFNFSGEPKTYDIKYGSKGTIDPTVVLRIPGPSGNIIHFFASNHDVGCISSIKYFTNKENLKEFECKYLNDSPYFVGIFNAEGIERTDISFDLLDIKSISDDELNSIWH